MSALNTDEQVPSRLPAGAVIAQRYRIDSVLAEGGMGIIYRGWHLTLCQPIAIKVVRPELLKNAEAVSRFLNEARAMASLHSVNVAQVLDVGRIRGDTLYMVLEYLEGQDLRTLLDSEGALPLGRAADYVMQACAAMQEVHALGIIHRDLKPENLFLANVKDGRKVLKVIDFGISKRLDENESRSFTEPDRSLGSPQYMPPEQISTPDHVDGRADIWSLGVVLFELLTNALPFKAHNMTATCARVLCGEPNSLRQLRPDLPEELYAIVRRCLEKNPKDRFADMAALAQALAPYADSTHARQSQPSLHLALLDERHSERTPAPAVESLIPRPRQHRGFPAFAAFTAAAAATMLTLNWPRIHESSPAVAAAATSGRQALSSVYEVAARSARWVTHPCATLRASASASRNGGQVDADTSAASSGLGRRLHDQLAAVCRSDVADQGQR